MGQCGCVVLGVLDGDVHRCEKDALEDNSVASRLSLFLAVITGAGDGIGKAYSFEVRWPIFMVWSLETWSCHVSWADLKGISCLSFLSS